MQLDKQPMETILRQAAAWQQFEEKKDGLRERLLAQARSVTGLTWWQRLLGRPLLRCLPQPMPLHARSEEAEKWEVTEESQEVDGLSWVRHQSTVGDILLDLKAVGDRWAEVEALRIEYRPTQDAVPDRGFVRLRWSAYQQAYIAQLNLGRVGRGVGIEVFVSTWAEVTEDDTSWAVRHAANDPTVEAWQDGWKEYVARTEAPRAM